MKNFLSALAENNRLGILEGVIEKFGTLMSAQKGEMELTITTASVRTILCRAGYGYRLTCWQTLDNKLRQRLETAIAKSQYSQGKKLKVVSKVNPEILGGLVVEIGERTIDYSVANKIAKMNKMLTDSV